ncbi:MAG: methyltransferase domain-containing protein [Planctomycetes bacterium]|nr:methyltransferase domain-containing protein [Planctomycetota bacterium]
MFPRAEDPVNRVRFCPTALAATQYTALLLLAIPLVSGCTSLRRLAYEGFSRDSWQQSARVIGALGIRPGDRIADLGAGSGYFTVRLSPAVGPRGKVFAVDVDKDMNEYLRRRLAGTCVENVEIILARTDDPLLPDAGIDLVLTVNTYHHIHNRPGYFRSLRRDLAPAGRVAVIDFDGRKFMRLLGHYTPKETLLREMSEAGYEVVESYDFLDRQSFVIFRAKNR